MINRVKLIKTNRSCRGLALIAFVIVVARLLVVPGHALAFKFAEKQKLISFGDRVYLFDSFGESVALDGDTLFVGAPGDHLSGIVGVVYVIRQEGTSWVQKQKLTASDGSSSDRFGRAVAIDGDTLVTTSLGAAYVFSWNGTSWAEEQKLTPSDGGAGAFGSSVSISGDIIVIGDRGSGVAGATYVFSWNGTTWEQQQKLTASDGTASNYFGNAVTISGDIIIVGAERDDTKDTNSGAVYVFGWNGTSWVEQQKLIASDGMSFDFFGCAVAIDGDTLIVGAYGDDTNGSQAGAAYVFTWNGSSWVERQKILAAGAVSRLGASVAVQGDNLVLGAPFQSNANGDGAGSAYVFRWNGSSWVQQEYLVASNGTDYANFGDAVAIRGDTIVVGSPEPYTAIDPKVYRGNGAAYLFKRDGVTWTEQSWFGPTEVSPSDGFGTSVALDGDRLVVGGDDGIKYGKAWVFQWDGSHWVSQQKLAASDGATDDYFGNSVAINGDTIVVGAEAAEAAYVFHWDGSEWTEQAKCTASDAATTGSTGFGYSVAIDGDTIVVGTYGGAGAYVFKWNGSSWSEQAKLIDSSSAGGAVAIDGTTIVVGDRWDDNEKGNRAGAAYVFVWDGSAWSQQAKLIASDGVLMHRFGGAVAIEGNTLVVATDPFSHERAAYVFTRAGTSWTEQAKLTDSGGDPLDYNHPSVSISGDTIVIGADGWGAAGQNVPGKAHIFQRNGSTWYETQALTAADGEAGDSFGESVALDGTRVVIGADLDDNDNLDGAGAAYVFAAIGGGDINDNGIVDLVDAILAIQITSGIIPDQTVYRAADVNGDGHIGLADSIYILQKVSGMR